MYRHICTYSSSPTMRIMHTFLKTAYVRFRLPSLVERAHIPWESISARLPVSPLYPCLPPTPHRPSRSSALFPPVHGSAPLPVPSRGCCTFFGTVHCVPPLRGVKWREAEWSGAAICL